MNESTAAWLTAPQRAALAVGVVALSLCGVGAFFEPTQFFFSYLFGYLFWLGLSLGCMCVLMIHHLTGGGWGYLVRRFLEAAIMALPVMALLFVPICLGLSHLYPWTHPDIVAHDAALERKHAFLNVPMFGARMALSFTLWIGAALYLNKQSFMQDATADPAPTRRLRTFSGPGLVALTLVASLAAVDLVMTLDRNFYSTIFPVQVIIGWILATFAFCTVMLVWVKDREPWKGSLRIEHFHSLGNFLLAYVMMWAYMAVSQLIVIWSGNLPKEIHWYLARVAGGWKPVVFFLGLFHFFLPFFLLLSRENKESTRLLFGLAIGILTVHAVEVFWQVAPALHPLGFHVSWMDPLALAGVGGIWLAVVFGRLKNHARMPQNDPRMKEALAHGH